MNISQEYLFKFAQKYLELEDHREAARSTGIHPNVADVAGRELLRRESTWFFIDQVKINAEYSKFKVLYDAVNRHAGRVGSVGLSEENSLSPICMPRRLCR